MVTILGSSWYPAVPATHVVRLLQLAQEPTAQIPIPNPHGLGPVIGIVLVRVDPPGEQKAYIGVAAGHDQKADEDFIADWGAHFPVDAARALIGTPCCAPRAKGEGST